MLVETQYLRTSLPPKRTVHYPKSRDYMNHHYQPDTKEYVGSELISAGALVGQFRLSDPPECVVSECFCFECLQGTK